MMEAVSISETSVNFYQTTRRNILEDGHIHTRRHENLISHTRVANCPVFGRTARFLDKMYGVRSQYSTGRKMSGLGGSENFL
jgi:hypothetical protein